MYHIPTVPLSFLGAANRFGATVVAILNITVTNSSTTFLYYHTCYLQDGSKWLTGFPWPINGNPENNLGTSCIKGFCYYHPVKKDSSAGLFAYKIDSLDTVWRVTEESYWVGVTENESQKSLPSRGEWPVVVSPILSSKRSPISKHVKV
jgi:hypothetical protein